MSIEVNALTKTFRMPLYEKGFRGALHQLLFPSYEEYKAVDHISFSIPRGETVACIGPTGAGKSTTIKMLIGILQPTDGTVLVEGVDPYKKRIENNRQIGVVFGHRTQLWEKLPLEDTFRLLRDTYEIPKARYDENLSYFVRAFDLSSELSFPPEKLSLGRRVQADFIAALLHDPKVLYLDEPMIGLDLAARETIRAQLKRIQKERNMTVLLTSHELSDVEQMCERVIVLDQGKLISDVSRKALDDMFARDHGVRITMKMWEPKLLEDLHTDSRLLSRMDDPKTLVVMFDNTEMSMYDVIERVSGQADIYDVTEIRPDMRLVLQKLYRSELIIR